MAPFVARRVAAIVKESLHAPARERFEASVRTKVESLGSTLVGFTYAQDTEAAVAAALLAAASRTGRRGPT